MKLNVVKIIDDEPRAGTYLIAKGFGRDHKMVLRLINKYKRRFKNFGTLKVLKLKSTGGRGFAKIATWTIAELDSFYELLF